MVRVPVTAQASPVYDTNPWQRGNRLICRCFAIHQTETPEACAIVAADIHLRSLVFLKELNGD